MLLHRDKLVIYYVSSYVLWPIHYGRFYKILSLNWGILPFGGIFNPFFKIFATYTLKSLL